MSNIKHIESLEVSEDIAFQQKEWRAERIGWLLMAAIILLALLGFFGGGLISTTTKREPSGFQITYGRFDRLMNPSQISLQLPATAIQSGEARFWIDRQYLDAVQVETVLPVPDSVEVNGDRVFYVVKAADPSQPVKVKIELWLQKSGLIRGQAGWEGGSPLTFTQFIFP